MGRASLRGTFRFTRIPIESGRDRGCLTYRGCVQVTAYDVCLLLYGNLDYYNGFAILSQALDLR